MSLLAPSWPEDRPFIEHLLEWERRVTEYEQQTLEVVSGWLRVATVMRHAPASVTTVLAQQAFHIGADYGRLKTL
eukprot:8741457-Prorocentrum_lima.AAC.1